MRKILLATVAAQTAAMLTAPAALASTMPAADDRRTTIFGTGFGNGLGMSVDGPISGDTRLGLGFGLSVPLGAIPSYDLRLAHWMRTGIARLDAALMAGAFGLGPALPIAAEMGLGLGYELTPRLMLRGNLVVGTNFVSGLMWAPISGVELGYAFTTNLEGTLGYNGRGEIVGFRLKI